MTAAEAEVVAVSHALGNVQRDNRGCRPSAAADPGSEPTMVTKVDRSEIVNMLSRAAQKHGLDLESFFRLGSADELDNPSLRDLWLIWGDVLTDEDVHATA